MKSGCHGSCYSALDEVGYTSIPLLVWNGMKHLEAVAEDCKHLR